MKKVTIVGEKRAEIVEVSDPKAKAEWVVVKIHTAPMCTEYKTFASGGPALQMGHEAAGEVVDVAQPGRVKRGDRVVVMPTSSCGQCGYCMAGEYIHCQDAINFEALHGIQEGVFTMAQYMLKADWMLVPIPNEMSYDHASMACCGLGPTFGALERANPGATDTVLITGLGPVGLGGVINATHRGARVIGVDSNRYRAQKALDLGAVAVIDPMDDDALQQILDLTSDGRGVEHSVDCSGVPVAHRLDIDATRRKGTVSFVGESGAKETPVGISRDMIRKGLTLYGSWHYNMKDTPKIMKVIAANQEKLDELITHRYEIDEAQRAFELQLTGQCGKVLLKPWGMEQ